MDLASSKRHLTRETFSAVHNTEPFIFFAGMNLQTLAICIGRIGRVVGPRVPRRCTRFISRPKPSVPVRSDAEKIVHAGLPEGHKRFHEICLSHHMVTTRLPPTPSFVADGTE